MSGMKKGGHRPGLAAPPPPAPFVVAVAVELTVALALLSSLALGCAPDSVEADLFARADGGGGGARGVDSGTDARSEAPMPVPIDAGAGSMDSPSFADAGPAPIDAVASDQATGIDVADAPPASDGAAPAPDSGQALPCDVSGSWLVAQRVLVTAAGQQQSARTWYFYELRQEGSAVTVTRGLHCGYEVVKKSLLGASVDSSGAWPSFLARNSSAGRRGTVTAAPPPTSGGVPSCRLKLDREYVVRGATVPYYANPALSLPGRNQQAAPPMPGWEDWDGDGNPGISIRVSSTLASGTIYDCQREWTEYDGVFTAGAVKFKVPITANNEHVVLGRSAGSPQTLESSSSLVSDPAQHYVWLHRLQPAQVPSGDAEVCAAVRSLKDQLLPEAAQ